MQTYISFIVYLEQLFVRRECPVCVGDCKHLFSFWQICVFPVEKYLFKCNHKDTTNISMSTGVISMVDFQPQLFAHFKKRFILDIFRSLGYASGYILTQSIISMFNLLWRMNHVYTAKNIRAVCRTLSNIYDGTFFA